MLFHFHLVNFILSLTCISCILNPTSESQHYEVINFIAQPNEEKVLDLTVKSTSTNNSRVKCVETEKMVHECFKNLPPHLMEFLQTTKIIVVDREEIASKCTTFKHGMECFDRYAERCLSKTKVSHFQNNVAGARKFVKKICDEHKLPSGYLQNKECFYHIKNDWKRCTEFFQRILSDELNRSNSNDITSKYMEFCCARHAYETCIYNSARFKCFKNSTKFKTDTVKLFPEEKLFSNCRKYESLLCSKAEAVALASLKTTSNTNNLSFVFLMFWIISIFV